MARKQNKAGGSRLYNTLNSARKRFSVVCVQTARREIYVWHLTPPWNSLYLFTLAARVLPTAEGSPVRSSVLGSSARTPTPGHTISLARDVLKNKFS